MIQIESNHSPKRSVASGVFGIVFFSALALVFHFGADSTEGSAWFFAHAFSITMGALALLAVVGTSLGLFYSTVPPTILELSSTQLRRGKLLKGRLLQRGPLKYKHIGAHLVCVRSGCRVLERETTLSSTSGLADGIYNTEVVVDEVHDEILHKQRIFKLQAGHITRLDDVTRAIEVELPREFPPSTLDDEPNLESNNNENATDRVKWKIVVTIGIPLWPNVQHEFDLVVK